MDIEIRFSETNPNAIKIEPINVVRGLPLFQVTQQVNKEESVRDLIEHTNKFDA